MLVSVLMSVYNEDSQYIRESISSILNQTFKDFEFIIVGDSTESERNRVFSLIEEYASIDNRIIFVPNQTNMGLTKSLNIGLKYCSGKYIARMDADDISVLDRLEKQVCFMERNPKILASSAWFQFINKDGNTLETIVMTKEDSQELRCNILANSVMGHPVSIFHRIVNNEPVKYDETFVYAQDYALWIWFLQYGELSNIQEILLYYRVTHNQISETHRKQQYECAMECQRRAFSILFNFPIFEPFMKVLSGIALETREVIPENESKQAFSSFFDAVKVNKKNFYALEYLTFLYANYYYSTSSKKYYEYLFDVTKHNLKLCLLVEYRYLIESLKRIASF